MYKDNPGGPGRIWLAEDNGKLAGQYSLIFMRLKLGNQIVKASQNIDQMTHPDYRYQGIARELGKQALNEAGAKGVHITTGFVNEASYVVDLKAGFFDLCSLQTMIKPLNLENILGKYIPSKPLTKICAAIGTSAINLFFRARRPPKANGWIIKKISSFDDRINNLWKKVCNDYPILVVRDKEYLNWRYVDIPDVDYTIYVAEKEGEILGCMILRCRKQRHLIFGYIFDILVPLNQQNITYCLLSKAIEHFKEEKADLILYQMIGPKVYRKALKKNGFIFSRLLSRRFRIVVRVNTPKVSEVFLRDPGHWFVQIGDSDTI